MKNIINLIIPILIFIGFIVLTPKNQDYPIPENNALINKILHFQPEIGTTIIQPEKLENGWWIGAPSVIYDEQYKKFFMAYRIRKPWEIGRGTNLKIAESADGINFKN